MYKAWAYDRFVQPKKANENIFALTEEELELHAYWSIPGRVVNPRYPLENARMDLCRWDDVEPIRSVMKEPGGGWYVDLKYDALGSSLTARLHFDEDGQYINATPGHYYPEYDKELIVAKCSYSDVMDETYENCDEGAFWPLKNRGKHLKSNKQRDEVRRVRQKQKNTRKRKNRNKPRIRRIKK